MSLLPMNSASSRTLPGRVVHAAADTVRAIAQAWSLRSASMALQSLDDGILHDIGVARGDIDAAVRHGRAGLSS